jgi:uncharacterized membrane protein YtjA (UPF0391 family)
MMSLVAMAEPGLKVARPGFYQIAGCTGTAFAGRNLRHGGIVDLPKKGFAVAGGRCERLTTETTTMLGWALTFLIIALIAAAFGFGGIAGAAIGIAKILFFVFIVLFVLALIFGMFRGRRPVV